ncbi:TatD family hydrolase [Halomonas daqingensis]|uniref:TatD family hydrolase n=1 Tax=Billgrantia desiderata TaxID=52021 RepID=A0AAW4YXN9_9GAMM|nr:TatD family hydrolase [Halomonas desiderata]MCE8043077.1 TatD family hydrolase [Halomonas desiderata]MCE8047826.1 TatD family hydrolase [Halomonas desiderata]MCE8053604.1 TatD family hydrolase [Halomonas desiderata]OUE46387.1 hydrolase TatD [Halomonas desiderata SP1]
MFVDSHCHLDRLDPATHNGNLADALAAARARDVGQFLAVAVTLDDMPTLAAIAREHDDVAISAGVHPLHLLEREPEIDTIKEAAEHFGAVAIGECGLDYHYLDKTPERVPSREVQRERFRRQLVAATELELPVIVHTRDAREETLELIREHSDPAIGGVLHCFTEDLEMAREAVRHGFYISLSGIVSFRNAESLREVARRVPLDRLLIETDSPYLAPVPYRGKPNEPAWVVEVAECIAEARGISVEEVAMQTTANFYRLFRGAAPEPSDETRDILARAGLV